MYYPSITANKSNSAAHKIAANAVTNQRHSSSNSMTDRTSGSSSGAATAANGTDTNVNVMDALSRLSELFSDRSVGELAIVLDRHSGDVKAAAWALLNGERVEEEAEVESDSPPPQDQQPVPNESHSNPRHYSEEGEVDDNDNISNNYFYDGDGGDGDDHGDDNDITGNNDGNAGTKKQSLLVDWDVVDSPVHVRSAPEEIRRLYDEGQITQQEYETMVAADRRAAEHRESRQHGAMGNSENLGEKESFSSGQRTFKATKHLQGLADRLQKINLNLPALIDQMEKDQEVADQLDTINRENAEETERREMVREAERQSLEIMYEHLEEFLRENPRASYESWIAALHPDNVVEGKLLEGVSGSTEIDHRFFVSESDHRNLWNESISERNDADRRNYVQARTIKLADAQAGESGAGQAVVRDLLDSDSAHVLHRNCISGENQGNIKDP